MIADLANYQNRQLNIYYSSKSQHYSGLQRFLIAKTHIAINVSNGLNIFPPDLQANTLALEVRVSNLELELRVDTADHETRIVAAVENIQGEAFLLCSLSRDLTFWFYFTTES